MSQVRPSAGDAAPRLSVVFPAYNEEKGITAAVDRATRSLGRQVDAGVIAGFEILVVDDGSTDATADRVEALIPGNKHVHLLRHPVNRGIGAALRTGIGAADGAVVLYTDADMPVDLAAVADALPLLGQPGIGVVAGVRLTNGDGWFRGILTAGYDALAHCVFGVRARDINFPFKLMTTELVRRLQLTSEGSFVDLELLAGVQDLGLGCAPLPLHYSPRVLGKSSTLTRRVLVSWAVEVARNVPRLRRRSSSSRPR